MDLPGGGRKRAGYSGKVCVPRHDKGREYVKSSSNEPLGPGARNRIIQAGYKRTSSSSVTAREDQITLFPCDIYVYFQDICDGYAEPDRCGCIDAPPATME